MSLQLLRNVLLLQCCELNTRLIPSRLYATSGVGNMDWKKATSIYDFNAKDIDGNDVNLSKYKGSPAIIVNVASQCGYTANHYKELNEIYDKYHKNGLNILAFPCNQFRGQEPACDVDIKEFVKKKHVMFDMFSKIEVNGDGAHPLWKYLKSKQGGIMGFDEIKWNFTKFLIDKNGQPVGRFAANVSPKEMEKDVQAQLK